PGRTGRGLGMVGGPGRTAAGGGREGDRRPRLLVAGGGVPRPLNPPPKVPSTVNSAPRPLRSAAVLAGEGADGEHLTFDRVPQVPSGGGGGQIQRLREREHREGVAVRGTGRWARPAVPGVTEVVTARDRARRQLAFRDGGSLWIDAPGRPVDEDAPGCVRILHQERQLDRALRHAGDLQRGRRVVAIACVLLRNRVALAERGAGDG